MNIQNEILSYYSLGLEPERLSKGESQLEAVRTKEIIQRFIGKAPMRILDVGGGGGYYSFWLAEMGHEVYLVEPVPGNLEIARQLSRKKKSSIKAIIEGEARHLEFRDDYFDMVLLMGPLYHLMSRQERLDALYEARRVLKPEGVIICAVISRFASMLDGFFRNLVKDGEFIPIMMRDLKEGKHINSTGRQEYFTTAYFHHFDELKEEVRQGGFIISALLAVEGFGWLLPDFEAVWADETRRNLLLETIRAAESDSTIIGMSAHIIAVGNKA